MIDATTTAAPVCAHCGNTGAIGAGLYLAVDARWDAQQRAWLLQEREDAGGTAWDCLECDQQTPVHGDAALFPYGAWLPNDRHLIDALPALLAAAQAILANNNIQTRHALRVAITKATGA